MAEAGISKAHDSDHDLLIRIDTKLDLYMQRQTAFESEMRDGLAKKASISVTNDQESRLRKVERVAYIGIGISFVLQLLLAAYVGLHHL